MLAGFLDDVPVTALGEDPRYFRTWLLPDSPCYKFRARPTLKIRKALFNRTELFLLRAEARDPSLFEIPAPSSARIRRPAYAPASAPSLAFDR
jgi:hypothetical protein